MPDQLRAKGNVFRFAIKALQICGVGALIFAASPLTAARAPPDFAPSGNVSWIRFGEAAFKRPARGPGPVTDDPDSVLSFGVPYLKQAAEKAGLTLKP